MKKSFQFLVVILGASLMLAACGKKKDDGVAVRAAGTVRSSGDNINGGSTLPNGEAYNPGTSAAVVGSNQAQFQQSVAALVSATMDTNLLGNVSINDGVSIAGQVGILSNGSINASGSKIQLTIRDDKKDANGNLYEPIVIKVLGYSGSAINGNVNLVFSDEYGAIFITGNWDAAKNFRGQVAFQNKGQAQRVLGSFQMPLCSFFNCQ